MQKLATLAASFGASLLALATITPAPASASSPRPRECYGTTPNSRSEAVRNLTGVIQSLGRQGLRAPSIAERLARECGLKVVSRPSADSGASTASENTDVTLSRPQIVYYEPFNIWTAFAEWQWNKMPPTSEVPPFSCISPCNVGGYDGMAIAFNRPVAVVDPYGPWWMSTRSKNAYFPATYTEVPSDGNSNGVSFTGQDKLCFSKLGTADCNGAEGESDYSWYSGIVGMNIADMGCGTIQAFSKYAHGYGSTAVNGIGVGPWAISVQWSKTENRWEAVSAPSVADDPCTYP